MQLNLVKKILSCVNGLSERHYERSVEIIVRKISRKEKDARRNKIYPNKTFIESGIPCCIIVPNIILLEVSPALMPSARQ